MEQRPIQFLPTTVVSPPAQYATISRFEDVKQDGWDVRIGFNPRLLTCEEREQVLTG